MHHRSRTVLHVHCSAVTGQNLGRSQALYHGGRHQVHGSVGLLMPAETPQFCPALSRQNLSGVHQYLEKGEGCMK